MRWLKNLISKTPWESGIKQLYHSIRPPKQSQWSLRIERDQQWLNQVLPALIKPNSNCLDIGAHQGLFLRKFLDLAPCGHHIAFEPLPDMFEHLKKEFPQLEKYQVALSDHDGTMPFYKVNGAPAWSGFKLQQYPVEVQVEEIQVEVRRLDGLLPNYRPDFIKVDVEGAEYQVFSGARSLIKRHKPVIMFEHAAIHNEKYQTTPQEVHQFFASCEMAIYRLNLQHQYNLQEFIAVYNDSLRSNYDCHAETNFIAMAAN